MAYRLSHLASRLTLHACARAAGAGASRFTVLVAMAFGAVYLLTAVPRVIYPYDLDFIEDGLLMQSLRVANGQPVFLPPNAEFVPHVYMPLCTWLGGLAFRLTGPGFAPLRLMSFTATIATALTIYWIARRESGQRWVAVSCAGLFFGGYSITGGWYELARVDALFVALSLAGVALAVYGQRSGRSVFASALLLALAFLTKQNAGFFALAVAVYLLSAIGRRAWLFIAAFTAMTVAPVAFLHFSTGGWFSTYVFGIAYASPVEMQRLVDTLRYEVFGSMALLTIGFVWMALASVVRQRRQASVAQAWLWFTGVAVAVSAAGRASVGGNLNNLMPAYAFLCLVPALEMRGSGHGETHANARPLAFIRRHAPGWIAAAVLVQFALAAYNPARFLPTTEMREAGDRLIERIASIDGEVLVLMHPYYAVMAGKSPGAQIAAMWHARWRGRDPLPADFVERVRSRYYAAIISDESEFFEVEPALIALIEANYARGEELTAFDAPPTLTGVVVRPRTVYVPRPQH